MNRLFLLVALGVLPSLARADVPGAAPPGLAQWQLPNGLKRSEEHTSELQSLV